MSKKSTEIGVGKKVLASALSAAMVVAFAPAVALAGEGAQTPTANIEDPTPSADNGDNQAEAEAAVAMIGEIPYSTLQGAIDGAAAGAIIELCQSVVLDSALNIQKGKQITIDFCGHVVTRNGSRTDALVNYGDVTLVSSVDGGGIVSSAGYAIVPGANSRTTIKSGKYQSVEGSVALGETTVGAVVNIDGGVFTTTDNAVVIANGSAREGNPNVITITDGIFNGTIQTSGYVACGIYAPWKDIFNVKGGTFNITGGAGIVARAGQVNVTGGVFNTTGNTTGRVGDSRVVVPCSAIVFDEAANYPAMDGDSSIVVNGGTFSSEVDAVSTVSSSGSVEKRIRVSNGSYSDFSGLRYATSGTYALNKNVNVASQVNVPAGVTLDGNGNTVTAANPGEWSGVVGQRDLVLLNGNGSGLKNITLDSAKKTNNEGKYVGPRGVQVYNAKDVTLQDVAIKNSAAANLNVNASEVTLAGKIDLSGAAWADGSEYVNLSWGSDIAKNGKSALNIASGATLGFNRVWTDAGDLSRAGVEASTWGNKFAIKDGRSYYSWNAVQTEYKDGEETKTGITATPSYNPPSSGGGSVTPTPTPKPDPEPTPKPEPTPAAPGTNVSGTDASGNTVEATVTGNEKTTLPDGTEAAGSVEYKGTAAGSGSSEPASSASIPASVTSSDGTVYAVTKIADDAFNGQSQLQSVSIPATVVEIGERAFAGTGLASVQLPAATSAIGKAAFKGCASLKTADISKAALTQIPADAFNGTSITSIDVPASVKSIGARAFKGTKLKSLESKATTIGASAFAGCKGLKTVSLPDAVTLGARAFSNAPKLKTVRTGRSLKGIGPRGMQGSGVRTLRVESKKLTEAGVKNSLKGSKVTKVEVAVAGSEKVQGKYVSKYREMFKKSVSGKMVKVVKAKKAKK